MPLNDMDRPQTVIMSSASRGHAKLKNYDELGTTTIFCIVKSDELLLVKLSLKTTVLNYL